MSVKEKLKSLLFRKKPEAAEDQEAEDQARAEAAPEQAPAKKDPSVVELQKGHPLLELYDQRQREVGGLPGPRLCLDEDGVLPAELVKREAGRLQSQLRTVSSARLKDAGYGRGQRQGKKRKEDPEETAEEELPQALDADPWFFLSHDLLYAWVLVFPPVGQGKELSRELLLRAMEAQNIVFGINDRLVERLSRDERRYLNLFLIAQGRPAFDGKNGNVVDYFPRAVERILQVNEYDQVDYTALNLINNVEEGQEICRLIRPTEGEPGRTVLDQEIAAKSGKPVPLPQGRNTEISEDGDSLLAAMSGHVEFSGRSFQVKPVMEIGGNVDFSTGNIKFVGDVHIKGDVMAGFSVRAMGSVWVGGVLEAGSTVEAGGDLTVVKGILGDGGTIVRAQRCVFSKYIENATISVRENLQTDAIINGDIYCGGEVVVRSGRGVIVGGQVWAGRKISATAVGSRSESRTAIILGGLPCSSFERTALQMEREELSRELAELEEQLDSRVKESLMGKAKIRLSTVELRLQQLAEEQAGIEDQKRRELDEAGRLECGVAYAGTEITCGKAFYRVRREIRQCTAHLCEGEIVVV